MKERYVRYPLAELILPRSGFLKCFIDYWWAVTEDDQVLFYRKKFHSPQCNSNKTIVERLCPRGTVPRFVPVAFLPVDPTDYQ